MAGAAAAAALLMGASASVGCSAAEHPTTSRGAGEADLKDAIPRVRRLWEEVTRLELQQSGGRRMRQGFHVEEPRVRLLGDQLSVQVTLRECADPTSVLYECAAALLVSGTGGAAPSDQRGGSVSVRLAETGAARVLQLEAGCAAGAGQAGEPGNCRRHAQVFIPLLGEREQLASAEILKGGRLDDEDIEALRGIFTAAITCKAPGPEPVMDQGTALWQWPQSAFPSREEKDGGARQQGRSPNRGHTGYHQEGGTGRADEEDFGGPAANKAAERLRSMGAQVFPPRSTAGGSSNTISWAELAGYEAQKATIEDTLLLALQHPEVYERIAKQTRASFASNRPRAVLFEGPPGTGKTTSGRIIARQASVPMVYIPLESVMSKYYGESERLLAEVFRASEALGGCIIFLDEVDSLATTRGSEMHEATRRMLGVLLRQLDGFDNKRSVVIAATNRKQDLDPALLSRFDATVLFDLPDMEAREKILKQFAKHLSMQELHQLALSTKGMSGRDLRDVCEQTERKWASKVIRNEVGDDKLPRAPDYLAMAKRRREERK